MDTIQYVRRETVVSAIINSALTALLFFAVFGGSAAVPAWGAGGWVFDFVPQGFMIALMSTLVPGFLAQRKVRAGLVTALPGPMRLPRSLLVRGLVLAVAAAVLGTASVALVTFAVQLQSLSFGVALALKVAYGAGLAAVVTPVGLRATLMGA